MRDPAGYDEAVYVTSQGSLGGSNSRTHSARGRSTRYTTARSIVRTVVPATRPGSVLLLSLLNHISERRRSVQSEVELAQALYVIEERIEVSEVS